MGDNSVHIASPGDGKTLCGVRITPAVATTAQPANSSCDECYQIALEEGGDRE